MPCYEFHTSLVLRRWTWSGQEPKGIEGTLIAQNVFNGVQDALKKSLSLNLDVCAGIKWKYNSCATDSDSDGYS